MPAEGKAVRIGASLVEQLWTGVQEENASTHLADDFTLLACLCFISWKTLVLLEAWRDEEYKTRRHPIPHQCRVPGTPSSASRHETSLTLPHSLPGWTRDVYWVWDKERERGGGGGGQGGWRERESVCVCMLGRFTLHDLSSLVLLPAHLPACKVMHARKYTVVSGSIGLCTLSLPCCLLPLPTSPPPPPVICS
ncbi:uncharacterized protein LY79DRAFT_63725 [Colletotrichum navitas]|uniref:Uncharacterized protein n=1 Tax=Colletotrichum navitas TaxID=681940 RepID=A0AAD8Q723_9PEZI|nr:uncharacterized protein LY79DRAFT_63725 [Colletotrichum navitas]KAK1596398.1 hypothetical protein LY79DRAFT_63725 [Colletotrichum navitas]